VKFVQTIRFSTTRFDEMKALNDEFDAQGGDAPGFLGVKILKDRERDNAYMLIAEFESYELAMENSGRPETDAFAKRMGELVDGQLDYDNYDLVDERQP
jgi:antibiotic biosynthesis monooxygenase (ABM) superfamily enzyme